MSSALSTSEGSVGGRAASYQLSALLAMQRWRQRQHAGEQGDETAAAATRSASGEDGLDVLMREHDEQMVAAAAARIVSSASVSPQQTPLQGIPPLPEGGDISSADPSSSSRAAASAFAEGSGAAAPDSAPKPRTILEAMEGFRKALAARPPPPPKAPKPPRNRSTAEQVWDGRG